MPAIKVTANTSGQTLWNAHEHKRGVLVGLKIDNKSATPVTIDLLDCFTTDSSKLNSTEATQAAEDIGTTAVGSGKVKFQTTVPAGENHSLGKADLEETTFLGKAVARGDVLTSDCVVVAAYRLK